MGRMTGGEALVQSLWQEGVSVVFGLLGVQIYGAVAALRDEPRTYLSSSYSGNLGYEYPTALGAKVARPDRPVRIEMPVGRMARPAFFAPLKTPAKPRQ